MADPTAPSSTTTLEGELRAITDWWRDAGVDQCFSDTPQSWLAEPEDEESEAHPGPVTVEAAPPPPKELLAGGPERWPATLEAFDQWWLTEPALTLGPQARVVPRGPATAELLVLVPQPETGDGETLLSGPQGELLGNMLAAFGIGPERSRIASLIPAHLPHPDWPALDRAGWGALARRHLALAAPRRLLVLGQVALPLLGHDPAQGAAAFVQVAHEGGEIPALAAQDLDALLHRPRFQARLWQRWLDWTDGNR